MKAVEIEMQDKPAKTSAIDWARHGYYATAAQAIADALSADELSALHDALGERRDPLDEPDRPPAVGDEVEVVGPSIGRRTDRKGRRDEVEDIDCDGDVWLLGGGVYKPTSLRRIPPESGEAGRDELARLRADIARLTRERDEARAERDERPTREELVEVTQAADRMNEDVGRTMGERDAARHQVEKLREQVSTLRTRIISAAEALPDKLPL